MINLSNVKDLAIRGASRTGLILRKRSPEILLGLGIAGGVAATIMACKASLKFEEVNNLRKERLAGLKEALENSTPEVYSQETAQEDKKAIYAKFVRDLVVLYGPSVALYLLSVACIIGSHNILSKRNTALMAAYAMVEKAFKEYRKRVSNEYGEEKEREIRFGKPEELAKLPAENSEQVDNGPLTRDDQLRAKSEYARYFDDTSTQWQTDPSYNMVFLKATQQYFNDELKLRGHVFLNEVYDRLGVPRTSVGQIVGWVWNSKFGDNNIDFDIWSPDNRYAINGYQQYFILDFNVDGVIYDLI